ncbi:MAG: tRNA dihydrouridine synthase DusB [Firmicutes bacterium]|nr:tRNA dihydrouridine synthase DusB [Bacillota bacterium]
MYQIGSLKLENPFLLAPMAGITDSAFRRLCREQGAALVYSEMISCKGLCYKSGNTESLLAIYEEEKPVAYQLFGSEPEFLFRAAEMLAEKDHAMVDINMGCPVAKVVKDGSGSALLNTPEIAAELVKAVVSAEAKRAEEKGCEPRPVTVKCRKGWDDTPWDFPGFLRRMEDAGASAIAIHGRTREQFYSDTADWEAIAAAKDVVSLPVIGSGDIFSGEDALRMMKETGCEFVMMGRGALGNPWIFRDAKALLSGEGLPPEPAAEERYTMIRRHMELLMERKRERVAVCEMRKHIGWYIKGLPRAAEIRKRVNEMLTFTELISFLENSIM